MVGNKADKEDITSLTFNKQKTKAIIEDVSDIHIKTSAKDGDNVEKVFNMLVTEVLKNEDTSIPYDTDGMYDDIIFEVNNKAEEPKGKCCGR